MRVLSRAYRRWLLHQDMVFLRLLTTVQSWGWAGAIMTIILIGLSEIPAFHSFTEISFWPAFQWFAPAWAMGLVLALVKHRLNDTVFLALLLPETALVQLFCASLIVMANPQASSIFEAMFLFVALYYGFIFRSTPKEPFHALTILLALAIPLSYTRELDKVMDLTILGVLAFFVSFLLGGLHVRLQRQNAERKSLSEAVLAQVQNEQSQQIERLRTTLVDVLATNHDLNNSLQLVLANAEFLAMNGQLPVEEDRKAMLEELMSAALRIKDLTQSIKNRAISSEGAQREVERVDLADALEQAVRSVRHRHPKVEITIRREPEDLDLALRITKDNFFRIMENLLLNACEGNGIKASTTVVVRICKGSNGGSLLIDIIDNGPGFTIEQLSTSVTAFGTTKKMGSGLGLYTVEKLVAASGGKLGRSNHHGGGALVTLELPL